MVGLAPWSNDFANGLWFADTRSARLRTRSSVVGSMLGQPAHDLIWVSFGIDALFFFNVMIDPLKSAATASIGEVAFSLESSWFRQQLKTS